jgi:hypothetical protein
MIDLLPKLAEGPVRDLLSYCVGYPTPDKRDQICRHYRMIRLSISSVLFSMANVLAVLVFTTAQESAESSDRISAAVA